MSAPVVLRIPRPCPTVNELRRKYRHWAAYKDLLALWGAELLAAKGARTIPEATGPMRVTITAGRRRLLDDDGVAVKPILDLLTRPRGRKVYGRGWIVDDHPKWCRLRIRQQYADPPFTEIRIEPDDGGPTVG